MNEGAGVNPYHQMKTKAPRGFGGPSRLIILLSVLLIGMGGCQSLQFLLETNPQIDNPAFMSLVEDYNQCQTETDPSRMQEFVLRLEQAPTPISIEQSPIPVPKILVQLTSKPISRLAIDPQGMAASCTLRTGKMALKIGEVELARNMFRTILLKYSDPHYAYYVDQAHLGLSQISSLKSTSTIISSLPSRAAYP